MSRRQHEIRWLDAPAGMLASALRCIPLLLMAMAAVGCQQEMANQPRIETYEAAAFFADGSGSRPQVTGTIARGQEGDVPPATTGVSEQNYLDNPYEVTEKLLHHGQRLYAINCRHCHGLAGYGDGMVVQRGFPRPPSYHVDRLRKVPDGRIFEVISVGHGRMPALGHLIATKDRWAIISFVRALQLSQHVEERDLTRSDLKALSAVSSEEGER